MMDTHQQPQRNTPSYEAAPSLSSRPTLGFPLGTALLLIIIFCLSGVLSCCYHWDKIQALRRRALRRRRGERGDDEENGSNGDGAVPAGIPPDPPFKPSLVDQYAKQDRSESLPVVMPGDRIPKFIAWPCPWDLPAFAAPPHASAVPPKLDKLVTMDERPSPTSSPPAATVSCATMHTAGPGPVRAGAQQPTLPLDGVV